MMSNVRLLLKRLAVNYQILKEIFYHANYFQIIHGLQTTERHWLSHVTLHETIFTAAPEIDLLVYHLLSSQMLRLPLLTPRLRSTINSSLTINSGSPCCGIRDRKKPFPCQYYRHCYSVSLMKIVASLVEGYFSFNSGS
jgi:hypothetical protein